MKNRFLKKKKQEKILLRAIELRNTFSIVFHEVSFKYFINVKRYAFGAKDQWTVTMATKKPFGKREKNAVKSKCFNP